MRIISATTLNQVSALAARLQKNVGAAGLGPIFWHDVATEVRKWQPMDTAPKDGTQIVVTNSVDVFAVRWEHGGRRGCPGPDWYTDVYDEDGPLPLVPSVRRPLAGWAPCSNIDDDHSLLPQFDARGNIIEKQKSFVEKLNPNPPHPMTESMYFRIEPLINYILSKSTMHLLSPRYPGKHVYNCPGCVEMRNRNLLFSAIGVPEDKLIPLPEMEP